MERSAKKELRWVGTAYPTNGSAQDAEMSLEAYEKVLTVDSNRALNHDLKTRYKSAGELAGPLFGYALDQNLIPSRLETQLWLESVLGLLV